MKFKKRHVLLLLFAFLPFLNFIHFDDYCFGDAELLIIGGLTIAFFIAFLVISFHDLYSLSIDKLRFNFVPLTIVLIFSILFYFGLNHHDKNFSKDEVQIFKNEIDNVVYNTLILFDDNTFELSEISIKETCTKKGTYQFKKDSLFLNRNDKTFTDTVFDSIYYFNKKDNLLISKESVFSNLRL